MGTRLRVSDNGWNELIIRGLQNSGHYCDYGWDTPHMTCDSYWDGPIRKPFTTSDFRWNSYDSGKRIVFTNESLYRTETHIGLKVCETHPRSGTDRTLIGQPGGTMKVDLRDTSSWYDSRSYYLMDLRGYVDTPYPCDDGD